MSRFVYQNCFLLVDLFILFLSLVNEPYDLEFTCRIILHFQKLFILERVMACMRCYLCNCRRFFSN